MNHQVFELSIRKDKSLEFIFFLDLIELMSKVISMPIFSQANHYLLHIGKAL